MGARIYCNSISFNSPLPTNVAEDLQPKSNFLAAISIKSIKSHAICLRGIRVGGSLTGRSLDGSSGTDRNRVEEVQLKRVVCV